MLLRAPGLTTLKGLRDTAMIALALTTGIRASELTGLQVKDLRRKFDGETALHVRHGKGNKTRLVPYGDMIWSLDFFDKWLESANIQSGAVFRRLYWFAREQKHHVKPNEKGMHSGALKEVLEVYPIEIENKRVTINPHDLRRTYALRCYDAGMDLTRIQRNLGHTRADTTLVYLGQLDGNLRRPPNAYDEPNDLIQQLKTGETS
jgi:site-specific recombinase XerD